MVSSKSMVCLILIAVLCFGQLAVSVRPAQAYGMDVVFKDVGFGLLIGTVMAGLLMGANPNTRSEDWGRGLAVGGAVGATVGLGIGMASTYKSALLTLDSDEKLAFSLPVIHSDILSGKTSVGVLSINF